MFYLVFFSLPFHLGFFRCFVLTYLLLIKTRVVLYFSLIITLRRAHCCTALTHVSVPQSNRNLNLRAIVLLNTRRHAPGTEISSFQFDMWLRVYRARCVSLRRFTFLSLWVSSWSYPLSLVHHASPTPDCAYTIQYSPHMRLLREAKTACFDFCMKSSFIICFFLFVFIPVGKWLCRSLKGFHCSSSSMCICVCLSVFVSK